MGHAHDTSTFRYGCMQRVSAAGNKFRPGTCESIAHCTGSHILSLWPTLSLTTTYLPTVRANLVNVLQKIIDTCLAAPVMTGRTLEILPSKKIVRGLPLS